MRFRVRMILLAIVAAQATAAPAGVYTDDLAKCLVSKSTDADKIVLMLWFYSSMSASPAVKEITSITPKQRDDSNRNFASLVERLTLSDCRAETVSALKYEGGSAFEASFRVLGEVAARSLMSDPNVASEIEKFAGLIDAKKFEALSKEAGIPVAGGSKAPAAK